MNDTRTRYFICGLRPAQLVDEGKPLETCYAFDWKTGELVRDDLYYFRIVGSKDDIDEVTEEVFLQKVAALRAQRRL